MTKYDDYLARGRAKWGDRFSAAGLKEPFISAFNSGERVTVNFGYETKRGTIGVTTGWAPAFILLLTKRSRGSIYIIGEGDRIVPKGTEHNPDGTHPRGPMPDTEEF